MTKCVVISVLWGLTLCKGCQWYQLCQFWTPYYCIKHIMSQYFKCIYNWVLESSRWFHGALPDFSLEVVCLMVNWCSGYSHRPVIWRPGCWGGMGQAIDRPETESSAVLLCRAGHTVRPVNRCRTQPPSPRVDEQLYVVFTFYTKVEMCLQFAFKMGGRI